MSYITQAASSLLLISTGVRLWVIHTWEWLRSHTGCGMCWSTDSHQWKCELLWYCMGEHAWAVAAVANSGFVEQTQPHLLRYPRMVGWIWCFSFFKHFFLLFCLFLCVRFKLFSSKNQNHAAGFCMLHMKLLSYSFSIFKCNCILEAARRFFHDLPPHKFRCDHYLCTQHFKVPC